MHLCMRMQCVVDYDCDCLKRSGVRLPDCLCSASPALACRRPVQPGCFVWAMNTTECAPYSIITTGSLSTLFCVIEPDV